MRPTGGSSLRSGALALSLALAAAAARCAAAADDGWTYGRATK
jgi:hypothetical protein